MQCLRTGSHALGRLQSQGSRARGTACQRPGVPGKPFTLIPVFVPATGLRNEDGLSIHRRGLGPLALCRPGARRAADRRGALVAVAAAFARQRQCRQLGGAHPGGERAAVRAAGRHPRRGVGRADHVQGRVVGRAAATHAARRRCRADRRRAVQPGQRQPRAAGAHRPHHLHAGTAHGAGQADRRQRRFAAPAAVDRGNDVQLSDPRHRRRAAAPRGAAAGQARGRGAAPATPVHPGDLEHPGRAAAAAGAGVVAAETADRPPHPRRAAVAAGQRPRQRGAADGARTHRAAQRRAAHRAAQRRVRRAVRRRGPRCQRPAAAVDRRWRLGRPHHPPAPGRRAAARPRAVGLRA